jgi:alanine racemase
VSLSTDAEASPPVGFGAARSAAVVDLAVIRANVAALLAATPAGVMAVVKADGYGHGLLPSARAAVAGGASWLAVAYVAEALALRAGGVEAPVLAMVVAPGEDLAAPIAHGIDLSVGAVWLLDEVVAAARTAGRAARVHLEADTGLSRGGATAESWSDLLAAAARAAADGTVEVVGLWSHFACSDEPQHPANSTQLAAFHEALAVADRHGITPQVRHMANSAATLTNPAAHFDLVRPGIAVYGVPPGPDVDMRGLVPAMTLTAQVALTKRVPAGSGVSYGLTYTTPRDTLLALVPLGYGDGVPRHASGVAEAWLAGRRRRIAGRVCMDQFVLDVGDDPVRPGDPVLLFGPGDAGEPTAADWAAAIGTIGYEIVTRVGARVPRRYVGGTP